MMDSIAAFWRRIDAPGHDTAILTPTTAGWTLTGFAVFHDRVETGLRYQVDLSRDFRTVSATVDGFRSGRSLTHRFRREAGDWFLDDVIVPGLGDLIHLDFGFTPATNLQQLRHAGLAVGEEADIPAAWFDIGGSGLKRLEQHYVRTGDNRYRYGSKTVGYEAVLDIAPNGFVSRYPGLWEMTKP